MALYVLPYDFFKAHDEDDETFHVECGYIAIEHQCIRQSSCARHVNLLYYQVRRCAWFRQWYLTKLHWGMLNRIVSSPQTAFELGRRPDEPCWRIFKVACVHSRAPCLLSVLELPSRHTQYSCRYTACVEWMQNYYSPAHLRFDLNFVTTFVNFWT